MKDDYSDVILSQGLMCLNTNNNALCVVIDGHRGDENDRCSLVLELSEYYGFIVHTPPNRALRPTGKICNLQPLAKVIAKYVVVDLTEGGQHMTDDTKRALEAIEPIAKALNIKVLADDKFLYLNGQAIGIGCNSTWATVNEFIGYAFVKTWTADKSVRIPEPLMSRIKRYWFTKEQLKKMIDDGSI